jgi:hypothetical protein
MSMPMTKACSGGVGKHADVEQGVALAAHVEGVEELAHGEGGEGHGVGDAVGHVGVGEDVFASQ